MPGPRPIDSRQHSTDRFGMLKQQTQNLQNAVENKSVDVFSSIPNLTGSGNLVFDTNPILNNPQLSETTKIITKEVITYTDNPDQVIFSFPLYTGQNLDPSSIIGTADIVIQSEESEVSADANGPTGPMPPQKVTLKSISKLLVILYHDYNNGGPQSPNVHLDEYAGVHIVTPPGGGAGDVSTYGFVYNPDTKTFDITATPVNSKVIRHRICAICMLSSEQQWKI